MADFLLALEILAIDDFESKSSSFHDSIVKLKKEDKNIIVDKYVKFLTENNSFNYFTLIFPCQENLNKYSTLFLIHTEKNNRKGVKCVLKSQIFDVLSDSDILTKGSWDNYKRFTCFGDFKKEFNLYREITVNYLIKSLNVIFCENHCTYNSTGAVGIDANLNSDLDITIEGFYIYKVHDIFHEIFNKTYGMNSNIFFDTNIYGYSFFMKKIEEAYKLNVNIKIYEDNGTSYIYLPWPENGQKPILEMQDKFVLLRLETHKIENVIVKNNDINNSNEKFGTESLEQYQNQLLKINKMIYKTDNINHESVHDIIKNISILNSYGNETYFSQGSFHHIIVSMIYFKKSKEESIFQKLLNKSFLIHSMIENVSYFLHTLSNSLSLEDKHMKRSNYESFLHASKYLLRFFDAYIRYTSNIYCNINYDEMKHFQNINDEDRIIYQDLAEIKTCHRGKILSDHTTMKLKTVIILLLKKISLQISDFSICLFNKIKNLHNFNQNTFILIEIDEKSELVTLSLNENQENIDSVKKSGGNIQSKRNKRITKHQKS